MQRERDKPVVVEVRQLALGLRPDELIGIELRCVTRKAVRLHSGMAAEKGLNVATPMDCPAVPKQDDFPAEMTEQLSEERDDFGPRDVAHVEVEVQAEAAAPRGHRERRNDGDFCCGVQPMGAQVLRTLGMSKKPLSSTNTRCAPRRATFFYPRPFVPLPPRNGDIIPLECTTLWLLPTPAHPVPQ